jgi:hypothetical protein
MGMFFIRILLHVWIRGVSQFHCQLAGKESTPKKSQYIHDISHFHTVIIEGFPEKFMEEQKRFCGYVTGGLSARLAGTTPRRDIAVKFLMSAYGD